MKIRICTPKNIGDWISIHRIYRLTLTLTYVAFTGAIKTTDASLTIEAGVQEAKLSGTSSIAPGKTTGLFIGKWSIGGIFEIYLEIGNTSGEVFGHMPVLFVVVLNAW